MPAPHNHHCPNIINIINIASNITPYGLYFRCSVARPFILYLLLYLPAHGQLSGFHKAAVEAILLHQLPTGSTKMRMGASFIMARAMAMRCRSPPERCPPAPPHPFHITACPFFGGNDKPFIGALGLAEGLDDLDTVDVFHGGIVLSFRYAVEGTPKVSLKAAANLPGLS